jgi:hypothetical protein
MIAHVIAHVIAHAIAHVIAHVIALAGNPSLAGHAGSGRRRPKS